MDHGPESGWRFVRSVALIYTYVLYLLTKVISFIKRKSADPQKRVKDRMTNTLLTTEDLETWKKCAARLDKLSGYDTWREIDESSSGLTAQISERIQLLQKLREGRKTACLMHELYADVDRGILNHSMFKYYTGTKRLVDEYFHEIHQCCNEVLTDSDVRLQEKYVFFKRISHSHGRTALLLSGGASLGVYHVGVVKALWESGQLPRILTGSSAGSIVASFFGTRTDEELDEMLRVAKEQGRMPLEWFGLDVFDNLWERRSLRACVWRLLWTGCWGETSKIVAALKRNFGDLTFQEAYERSGRVLCIPVCSETEANTTLVTNYVTTPTVLVYTAVAASCAFYGLFLPGELLCKSDKGDIVPYCPSRQKWRDGSINMDLPIKRISELFNVNCMIVSQVNPHVVPFLRRSEFTQLHVQHKASVFQSVVDYLYYGFLSELKHFILVLFKIGILPQNGLLKKLLDQKYMGDVTILPLMSVQDILVLLQNPTSEFFDLCTASSQRMTWPYLCAIQCQLRRERLFEQCIDRVMTELMSQFDRFSNVSDESTSENLSFARESISCLSPTFREADKRSERKSVCSTQPVPLRPTVHETLSKPAEDWDEETVESETIGSYHSKRKESRYVIERLHTFHPAKNQQRKRGSRTSVHLGGWGSAPSSVVNVSMAMKETDFAFSALLPDTTTTSGTNEVSNPVGTVLEDMLNWVEGTVSSENKIILAEWVTSHMEVLAPVFRAGLQTERSLLCMLEEEEKRSVPRREENSVPVLWKTKELQSKVVGDCREALVSPRQIPDPNVDNLGGVARRVAKLLNGDTLSRSGSQ